MPLTSRVPAYQTEETMNKVIFLIGVMSIVVACQQQEKLSFDSVESGRKQANENSEYNAKSYRTAHPEYVGFAISTASDSTQSATCGQGDGWATLSLTNLDKKLKVPLKCSTVSEQLGCMTDEEFKSKSYANQDGRCNMDIPFPLPKIQK
jgi:uncharacterized protein YccT (UPF0319 family)